MGVCREFGPQIQPDCQHPMRAGADSCTCPECGARCTGRFPACSQVWQRSTATVAVAMSAPNGHATTEPDVVDDTLPDFWSAADAETYVPPARARGAAWERRRFPPKVLSVGALVFLAALLLFAAVTSGGGESPDRLAVTDQTQVSTPATTTATSAPLAPPAPPVPPPTTLPDAPATTSAPPPATAAPPPPRPARAAPTAASTPARRPARATPAPTVGRFPRMCGFTPGSPVDVEINGRPAGSQTADRNGCVSRPGR
jgi:hypothetical protein